MPGTLTPGLLALLDSVPESATASSDSTFAADVDLAGYVARPETDDLRPGVLVLHDWSGLNDHARVRAEMLARLGYVALAGDVYGGGEFFGPEAAAAQAGRFSTDTELFRSRVTANLEHLRGLPGVDPDRLAVIGYCFGGTAALELARTGADVAGIVSFHGALSTAKPARPGDIRAPLLVLTGAADPIVPDAQVFGFEDELRDAGAEDWQLVSYSGAMHAFTMPDANAPEHGAAFQATANARSWVAMRAFFDEIFA